MNSMLVFIALASLAFSVAMSVVAWRAVRNERRRSTMRVAVLAAEIGEEDWPSAQPAPRLEGADMFALERDASRQSPAPVALMAGALIVGTIITVAVLLPISGSPSSRGSQGSLGSVGSQGSQGSVSSQGSTSEGGAHGPIELLALGHERRADRLTVHGVVRNPANGNDVAHLTAVVLLFNSAGAVVTTGRAAVEAIDLMPGTEAPFTVSVPDAADVGRYRVSFRTDDDHVVPHLDKRDGA